jgi:ribosomal protein S18 acetylase RimI-like enzyme
LEPINPAQPDVLLRECTPADLDDLLEISFQTFDQTFRPLNSPETMQAYLEAAFTPGKIAAELAEPRSSFYFLYQGGDLAGYLKLNEAGAQTDLNDPASIEVERIYVSSPFQGKGLGRVLIEKAISLARQASKQYLWLGVWQKNAPAIAFYKRMGFKRFATHSFMMGAERQTDDLMRLDLE